MALDDPENNRNHEPELYCGGDQESQRLTNSVNFFVYIHNIASSAYQPIRDHPGYKDGFTWAVESLTCYLNQFILTLSGLKLWLQQNFQHWSFIFLIKTYSSADRTAVKLYLFFKIGIHVSISKAN